MPTSNQGNEPTVKTEIISEDEGCTVIRISDPDGCCTVTAYDVLPGITFIYNDAHIQSIRAEERNMISGDIIEISHCREGRVECKIHGEFCYLTPGDIAIARSNSISSSSYFPLRHYHGLTVRIDLNATPQCLSCLLDDVKVRPKAIADKFCGANENGREGGFIARAMPSFEHIFSELYSVPEEIKKGYFKVKTLELLLFLSALDTERDELNRRSYTQAQVDLAKEVSRYLTENMDDRITLDQISDRFHVSGTHIKNLFKGVYGTSIGTYIRTQKMESAAYMLEYTDKSILDIAGQHGYDNGSKFAGAFRAVKGVSPTEYRILRNKAGKTGRK